jgi:hypothetical protein
MPKLVLLIWGIPAVINIEYFDAKPIDIKNEGQKVLSLYL